jgi:predicted nucleic acid-binding protein
VIFLDTSAIYALADKRDANHKEAKRLYDAALRSGRAIVTHNYVIVETAALLARRLGLSFALTFLKEAADLDVQWISTELHTQAVDELANRNKPDLSFVDAVSFLVMETERIAEYLGFDEHFRSAGFRRIDTSG